MHSVLYIPHIKKLKLPELALEENKNSLNIYSSIVVGTIVPLLLKGKVAIVTERSHKVSEHRVCRVAQQMKLRGQVLNNFIMRLISVHPGIMNRPRVCIKHIQKLEILIRSTVKAANRKFILLCKIETITFIFRAFQVWAWPLLDKRSTRRKYLLGLADSIYKLVTWHFGIVVLVTYLIFDSTRA